LGAPIFRCGEQAPCWELEGIAWSPDGARVAYGGESIGGDPRYNGLWVFDVAKGKSHHIRRQAANELGWYSIAWSPDGRHIAYVSQDGFGRRRTIYIVNADGSGRRRLDTGGVAAVGWPSWSPDGRRIAYAKIVAAAHKASDERAAVYVSRLDGRKRVLIAAYGTAPSWSPNGKAIAYLTGCGNPPFKNARLSGVRLASPTGRPVMPPADAACSTTLGVAGPPAWSPDGSKIAMATRHGVYTMSADGTNLTRFTATAPTSIASYRLSWMRPSWRPR
jgi:Tol biopolymer transport system component